MALKLAVISRDAGGAVFAAAYGDATARDFPTPETVHFDQLLGADWASNRVALDMDAISYVDSSAIGWLLGLQKKFGENGGRLVLHSVQPHVKNILSLLKIEKIVPVAADLDAARKMIQERARRKQTASGENSKLRT